MHSPCADDDAMDALAGGGLVTLSFGLWVPDDDGDPRIGIELVTPAGTTECVLDPGTDDREVLDALRILRAQEGRRVLQKEMEDCKRAEKRRKLLCILYV